MRTNFERVLRVPYAGVLYVVYLELEPMVSVLEV